MPGNAGKVNEFAGYPVINELEEKNSTWFSYVAEFDGEFYLSAKSKQSDLGLIVFETDFGRDICSDIESARAEVVRFLTETGHKNVALNKSRKTNSLYPIKMREGDEIHMVLYAAKGGNHEVEINFNYESEVLNVDSLINARNQKIVDLRKDGQPGDYRIMVRDADTDKPVISNLIIEGLRGVSGYYTASEPLPSTVEQRKA